MADPVVTVRAIGREGEPVVVIDNFSADPDRLLAEAKTAPFRRMGDYYPGVRAAVGPGYFDGAGSVLGAVARQVFGGRDRLAFDRALFSIATTAPHDLGLAQRIPHIDSVEPDRIAIIHYLTHDDLGGTAFYRHRSTGFETITPGRHRAYLDALAAEFRQAGEPSPAYIDGDTAQFERIDLVEPAFNRAVLYRGRLLHCAALPPAVAAAPAAHPRLTIASFGRVG